MSTVVAVLDVLEDSGRFLDSATSEKRVESKESKSRIVLLRRPPSQASIASIWERLSDFDTFRSHKIAAGAALVDSFASLRSPPGPVPCLSMPPTPDSKLQP